MERLRIVRANAIRKIVFYWKSVHKRELTADEQADIEAKFNGELGVDLGLYLKGAWEVRDSHQ